MYIKKNITRQNWKTFGNLIFDVTFLSFHHSLSLTDTYNFKMMCEDKISENFQKYVIAKVSIVALNYERSLFSKWL